LLRLERAEHPHEHFTDPVAFEVEKRGEDERRKGDRREKRGVGWKRRRMSNRCRGKSEQLGQ
jgi:hypothetical protein